MEISNTNFDWQSRPISELVQDVIDYRGKTPPKAKSGIPCISAANVKGGSMVTDGKFITKKAYDNWTTRGFVRAGDVLITTEAPVAEVAQVPGDQTYLITRRVMALQIDPQEASEKFVKYSLMADENKRRLSVLSHGATVPRLYKDDILDFELMCPPLKTQRKIAAVLSAYDDLIENNTRRNVILEEMAQAIYREWFVHFRFPGHEEVEMVASELGPIPAGWEVLPLGHDKVTNLITRGYQPKYDEESDCRVINQRCIRDHKINLDLTRGNDEKRRPIRKAERFLEFGDVLVNSTGVGTLGRVAQVYQDLKKHTVDSHVTIVRPSEQTNLDYLGIMMWELEYRIERLGVGATGQTELSRKRLGKVKSIIAPSELQEAFSINVRPMRKEIQVLLKQNENLRETRDLLLPRLISGELDVSELDIPTNNDAGG